MQQSQGIMSTIIESTSESWSRVGLLVMFQLVKNVSRVIWNEKKLGRLKDDEIERLQRILSMPISDVPRKMKFEIYTTDIEHSYEARRDTLMQLMEMTFQAQPQLVQLSQTVLGPQGMQLRQIAPDAWNQLLEIYVGSVNLLKEMYHFADFPDTEDYIQDVSKLQKLVEMMRQANAMQIQAVDAMRNHQGGMNGGPGGAQIPGGVAGATVAQGPGGAVQGGATGAPIPQANAGVGAGFGGQ